MRSWLSKLTKRPQHVEDQDFGKIIYMGGYWEGSGLFRPTQHNVEYFVTADEHGPSDANRQALQQICSNYAELLAKAVAAISTATSSLIGADDLALSSLDVPSGELGTSTWEMNFGDAAGTLFSVKFGGLDATGVVDISS